VVDYDYMPQKNVSGIGQTTAFLNLIQTGRIFRIIRSLTPHHRVQHGGIRTMAGYGFVMKEVAGGAPTGSGAAITWHYERGTFLTYMQIKQAIYLKIMVMGRRADRKRLWRWKKRFEKMIPVRSGHLASTILSTLRIHRKAYGNSRFWISAAYNYPMTGAMQRPITIHNQKHKPPDEGYGDYIGVDRTYKLPNVHLLYKTGGGGAKYLLNDPTAVENHSH